jgi:hypothetical protein
MAIVEIVLAVAVIAAACAVIAVHCARAHSRRVREQRMWDDLAGRHQDLDGRLDEVWQRR